MSHGMHNILSHFINIFLFLKNAYICSGTHPAYSLGTGVLYPMGTLTQA